MATQQELDSVYMSVAEAHASLSKAKRAKVGSCLVTTRGVVLAGYNGFSPGGDNVLEYESEDGGLISKDGIIHAELNSLLKAAKEGVSVEGGTMYVTLSCCRSCSEFLIAAGIKRVVYKEAYRCTEGLDNLISRGIIVEQFNERQS